MTLRISASQIEVKRRCQRLFVFQYVDGFQQPETDKQLFGSDGHRCLANYLKDGMPMPDTPYGRTAQQAIDKGLLPPPGGQLLIEQGFDIPVFDDVVLHGFVDCVNPHQQPMIIDHKLTSSTKWIKTPEQLFGDVQALVYAIYALQTFSLSEVSMRWIYYIASNPKNGERMPAGVKAIDITFSVNDQKFLDNVNEIEKDIRWIAEVRRPRKSIFAIEMPASPEACDAYGGCFCQNRCNLTVAEKLECVFAKHAKK